MLNSKFRKINLLVIFVFLVSILTILSSCTGEENKNPQQEQPQENYYTVMYLAEEGGAIDGLAEQSVKEGEDAEAVTAVPDAGYKFVKWSDGVTTATRQDANVTSAITVTAEFEKITYTVKYLAGEGGTISGNAKQQVKYGESATEVEAIPDEGYYFVKWSDGVTTATRQDSNVTSAITVTAEFEKITCTVQYLAGEGGTIRGNANQQVKYGENAEEVTAVPNKGYYFVKWSDGVTTATRQDSNVTASMTLTAKFEKMTYPVQYLAGEGGTIRGNAKQQVKYGESATAVKAIPDNRYQFVKWSDGVTTATRQDTNVTSAITVTAEFIYIEFAGGIGTQVDPYLIENYEQFRNIRYYPTANYKLISDLDLSGIIYEPYFTDMYRFEGTFDGNGRTIKNLSINSDNNFPSLFGFIGAGGIVKNLNIENADITAINFNTLQHNAQYCVGILAGVSFGTQVNVNVSGIIHGDAFQYDQITIGGLIGMAYGDTVNCNSDVNITASGIERLNNTGTTMPYVFGGLVGVYNSLGTKLNGCFAEGSLTVSVIQTNARAIAGGLVGYYFTERNSSSVIFDCNTSVVITGDKNFCAGGLAGRVDVAATSTLQIDKSSAHGEITNTFYCGGFLYNVHVSQEGEIIIENCYTDNKVTGISSASGFIYEIYGGVYNDAYILNCCAEGSVTTLNTGGMSSGFCYQANHVNFKNCYENCNVTDFYATGFGYMINYCNIESCFSMGNVYFDSMGGGFAFALYNSDITNCYSMSNIIIEISDKYPDIYTMGGFSCMTNGTNLTNVYFAGTISVSDDSIKYEIRNSVGAFIGSAVNTDLYNCHVLHSNKECTPELIGQIQVLNDYEYYHDLTSYDNPEDMYLLADKLNEGLDEEVWMNRENYFPQLKFMV